MVVTTKRADRVVLQSISWQQFEQLLGDLGEHRVARIAYDNGTLEIMTPLPEHEYFKEVIGDAVKDIADELDVNYASYGSTTWRHPIKMAGLEPDNCFYFQNEALVRGKLEVDLSQADPPPDLALEIDITQKSLDRFPIYARLGVPELWCYASGALKIYHLQNRASQDRASQDRAYIEAKTSLAFPHLPISQLPQLIEQYRPDGQRAIRRAIRAWARAHR